MNRGKKRSIAEQLEKIHSILAEVERKNDQIVDRYEPSAARSQKQEPPRKSKESWKDYAIRLQNAAGAQSDDSEGEDVASAPDVDDSDSEDNENTARSGDEDDDDGFHRLYSDGDALRAQRREYESLRGGPSAQEQESTTVAEQQRVIRRLAKELDAAERAAAAASTKRFRTDSLSGMSSKPLSVPSSDSGGERGEESEDDSDGDRVGTATWDKGDLDPATHPFRLQLTEDKMLREEAARLQGETYYTHNSIKLRVKGLMENSTLVQRAIAMTKLVRKELFLNAKGAEKARFALKHELEFMRKKKKVLDCSIQACAVADDCSDPEEALRLIDKHWGLYGKSPWKYQDVIKEVVKSPAYSLLLRRRNEGSRTAASNSKVRGGTSGSGAKGSSGSPGKGGKGGKAKKNGGGQGSADP